MSYFCSECGLDGSKVMNDLHKQEDKIWKLESENTKLKELLKEGTKLLTYMDIDKAEKHFEWINNVSKALEETK